MKFQSHWIQLWTQKFLFIDFQSLGFLFCGNSNFEFKKDSVVFQSSSAPCKRRRIKSFRELRHAMFPAGLLAVIYSTCRNSSQKLTPNKTQSFWYIQQFFSYPTNLWFLQIFFTLSTSRDFDIKHNLCEFYFIFLPVALSPEKSDGG